MKSAPAPANATAEVLEGTPASDRDQQQRPVAAYRRIPGDKDHGEEVPVTSHAVLTDVD